MAFYKKTENEILKGELLVATPNYSLYAKDKDNYTYPIDGWRWFDTDEDAESFYGVPIDPDDVVEVVKPPPSKKVTLSNGLVLAAEKDDTNAFTSMTVLVSLALQNGIIQSDTPQTIKDAEGILHEIPTQDFLGLMLEYGSKIKERWDAQVL